MSKESIELDLDDEIKMTEVETVEKPTRQPRKSRQKPIKETQEPFNCLQRKRVFVRHIPKEGGIVTNPKHILYGGMADKSVRNFTVPLSSTGGIVKVLTPEEQTFLEEEMGLEYNALSTHKKRDNYWFNLSVRLTKQDNILNLEEPEDYIKYKILLANKDLIAKSVQELEDRPKATYQFVISVEGDETKVAKTKMDTTMQCYKEYGKVEDDVDILRMIVETIDGRPLGPNTKIDFLQTQINSLIQSNNKLFLKVISDPLLATKVLIRKGVQNRIISKRGNYFYMKKDNTPLCYDSEEPTMNIAAKYLASPDNSDLKYSIEAQVNN